MDATKTDPIAFGTDGWRATLDVFTDERVRIVAQAIADHLAAAGRSAPVFVGYDARESSEGFAEQIAEVLTGNGFEVLLPERDVPTPVVAHAIVDRGLSGACMVTASHNPPEYNGVKFIPHDGAPALPRVTDDIESRLREPDLCPPDERPPIRRCDPTIAHADAVRDRIDADLSGLTVVYDAMHGSGRGITDRLLADAGADVIRLRCDRDPTFGDTPPEPSAENLHTLADTVRERDADLGIANDGDADRIAVATPDRGVVDANHVFATCYEFLLESHSGSAVRSVSTTFLIDRIAAAHGETVHETPVGFKWIAREMADHDALFGGEESGGFSIRGHVREKDGVLVALLVAAATREESLDDRLDRIAAEYGPVHTNRTSIPCPDDRKDAVMAGLSDRIPDDVLGREIDRVVTLDGFKLLLEDGSWLLVRPSGTEPKLRIYAESDDAARVEGLLSAGRDLIEPLV